MLAMVAKEGKVAAVQGEERSRAKINALMGRRHTRSRRRAIWRER
jgi:hypothetical protein